MSSAAAPNRPIEVLLVEDNPGDVRLTRIALAEGLIPVRLQVVEDGAEALAYLEKQGKYVRARRPDLVLLDLNLPKKDGREVLAQIKSDTSLRCIPVVILTTSQAEEDILRAYNDAANCYITKPVDFGEFLKIVRSIEDFWFTVVKLPPR
ncbi:response regulator [Gloeobacter violaceus]|uniref:Two-component response regulator n=1 Tax=Gloeobacter violaceus (strain ATCC 29082 / PCC 7421) TaxID=251221 RepID=Q7NFU1_GLOVI|nr:response regulator [Gloeobacter violaceus]BAC91374.1 two-component response regulator [Gloeobacter violaceus PCC 7421]